MSSRALQFQRGLDVDAQCTYMCLQLGLPLAALLVLHGESNSCVAGDVLQWLAE